MCYKVENIKEVCGFRERYSVEVFNSIEGVKGYIRKFQKGNCGDSVIKASNFIKLESNLTKVKIILRENTTDIYDFRSIIISKLDNSEIDPMEFSKSIID